MAIPYNEVDTQVRDAVIQDAANVVRGMTRGRVCHCCTFDLDERVRGQLYTLRMDREEDGEEIRVATFNLKLSIGETVETSSYRMSASAQGVTDRIEPITLRPTMTNNEKASLVRGIVHECREKSGLFIDHDVYELILPELEEYLDNL